jgi:NADH dehydrogenase FAD-containing subunit
MANPVYQTVILGGGFAGLFTALHLSHQHYPRSIILIDQNDRFCFKPLLYEYFSGEMEPNQVVPRYQELLDRSGIIFVQDTVQEIDLHQKQIQLASGDNYSYSNLVLALGSVTGYFNIEGAQEYALPFRTQRDAIALDHHLRDCLQRAVQLEDETERRHLLTNIVIGGGPTGVEVAATIADLVPQWYEAIGGNPQEVSVGLINHGEILKGDVNSRLRETAQTELRDRTVPVEMMIGAEVSAIRPGKIEYKLDQQLKEAEAGTIIWTAGTNTPPLIKSLPIPDERRDKHGRLHVTPTLQLPDFPEVFAGGDCAVDLQPTAEHDEYEHPESQTDQSTNVEAQHPDLKPLPPTAQVAYQQGAAIAYNLRAMALGYDLKEAHINLRGTLLKLGINNGVANLFNAIEIKGEAGNLIRQGTYLELLPTPIHNFKATTEWIHEEIFDRHHPDVLKRTIQAAEIVGGIAIGAVAARKSINILGNDPPKA